MIDGLAKLIRDYQAAVAEAIELLDHSGIPRPATPTAWVEYDISQRGQLTGNVPYFKHGYGCAVHLPTGKVDFDFGAEGQIDGFDLWRLIGFAGNRLKDYGFRSEDSAKLAFQSTVESGEIVPSAYILHYLAKKCRMTIPAHRAVSQLDRLDITQQYYLAQLYARPLDRY